MQKILTVEDLKVSYNTHAGEVQAVRGASFFLNKGETLAIVGESGSGKTALSQSLVKLNKLAKIKEGHIWFQGKDIVKLTDRQMQQLRGKEISVIFQDPMSALNPTISIGKQIMESLRKHQKLNRKSAKKRSIELLELVGIKDPEKRMSQFPHQFSGGMQQRVVIAIALACNPKILIADEPTTALDVTVQKQILQLLKELQKKLEMSIIFITHDLDVVNNIADRVAIIYAGKIVEIGKVDEIFEKSQHPYTWGLLGSTLELDNNSDSLVAIPGAPPNPLNLPEGDAFATRNKYALNIDYIKMPPMFKVSETHYASTWLLHEQAPKINREDFQKGERTNTAETFPKVSEKETNKEKVLEVNNLSIHFNTRRQTIKAVDEISFDIFSGETLGIVGESGSGKSTLGRSIMRLYQAPENSIIYKGKDIHRIKNQQESMELTRDIQMIFQDPHSSLNNRMTVSDIIAEGIDIHGLVKSPEERTTKIMELIETVGLNKEHANRYPHEFSGGQRQRIGIARALAVDPDFIVADEPVSALDVSIQAQIINLLKKIQKEKQLTMMFITHDLLVAKYVSDRIGVMYKGHLVEIAESNQLFKKPLHPYTRLLLSSIPKLIDKTDLIGGEEFNEEKYWLSTKAERTMREIKKDHWVMCTKEEFQSYKDAYNNILLV